MTTYNSGIELTIIRDDDWGHVAYVASVVISDVKISGVSDQSISGALSNLEDEITWVLA